MQPNFTGRMEILSERDKTGKGRMLNVGDLRGIRIPEIDKKRQKSAKTAVFSVSVATVVSCLPLLRRLNMPLLFCYTARGCEQEY